MKTPHYFICSCFIIIFTFSLQAQERPFITTWQVATDGGNILIPVNPDISGYNYTVNWGDGNTTSGHTGDASHTYATAGTYTVSISGDFPAIQFRSSTSSDSNDDKLRTIEQWGSQVWQSMDQAFEGCNNLTSESDTDAPVLVSGISFYRMFLGCIQFNSELNDWDVSHVTNMESMFSSAEQFNHDIGNWDVSNVTNMAYMFNSANAFNQDIGSWNVSNVTDMYGMFSRASAFNQDIGGWDISDVNNMEWMFGIATAFNQDIGGWDVSNVSNMENIFIGASAFDQNLGNWDISNVTSMVDMLRNSGLSTFNYDRTLSGWAQQNVQSNVNLGANTLKYCASVDARQTLIDAHGWNINGDLIENPSCNPGPEAFVTTWQISSNGEDITIPVNPNIAGYNYTVNWGDGYLTSGHTGDASHTYASSGTYTISITGDFPAIQFSNSSDNNKLITIEQWGTQVWQSMEFAFYLCTNLLTESDSDAPVFAPNIEINLMFGRCFKFNSDLNDWDVSNVSNMNAMFAQCYVYDSDLSDWDVSSVVDMGHMFYYAIEFNQDISGWDVSSVTNMQGMFSQAWDFSQIIGNWDIGNVTNMVDMLSYSGMYTYYYDRTLIGWAAQNVQSNVTLGAADLVFCAAKGPRQSLISNHNWTIIEDRLQDESCLPNRPGDFIMTWQVGPSDKNVLIPVNPALSGYNYIVHWGDGNVTVDNSGDASHTYVSEGTYTVSIKGDFPAIQFGSSTSSASNDEKLRTIEQWGSQVWQGMEQAFAGCSNLTTESSTDAPVFAPQSSLDAMFSRCSNLNSDLIDWDVSNVISMKEAFSQAEDFNGDIGNWNVSSVTDMSSMFNGAKAFNQNLGNWNISNVTNMQGMFREAYAFDQNIGNWNVSNVTRMDYMFNFTSAFNRDISGWNVSSVSTMESMFANASLFNQD